MPWMVVIVQKSDPSRGHCSASLIASKFILTAAHCFNDLPIQAFEVVLGTDDLSQGGHNWQKYQKKFNISKLHTHPQYEEGYYFDTAIIELEEEVTFSKGIYPICLPKEPAQPGTRTGNQVTLLGYGSTGNFGRNEKLRFATLQVFDLRQCNRDYKSRINVTQLFTTNLICAGSTIQGIGSCNGDSGGPLMKYHSYEEYYEAIAVTKGGDARTSCGSFPGIYTRLDDPEVFYWVQKVAFGVKESKESSHKFLIATGSPDDISPTTKIIDMKNDEFSSSCDLPNFPILLEGAIGGLVEGNIPMVCGGLEVNQTEIQDCYTLENRTWNKKTKGLQGRSNMGTGNVVINGKLLLSGGSDSEYNVFSSTTLVDTSSNMPIKDMPNSQSRHCNVLLNNTHIMITGGYLYDSMSETLIFDLVNEKWSPGPSMNEKRSVHGCTKMILDGKPFLWVSGGWGEDFLRHQSTEYLDLFNINQGWKLGPDLPYSLFFHRLVASEDFKSIYSTGGFGRRNRGEILELQCSGSTPNTCTFKPTASRMKVDRREHVVLPLSNSVAADLCT